MEAVIVNCNNCYSEHYINKSIKHLYKCSYCGLTNIITFDNTCIVFENAEEYSINTNSVFNDAKEVDNSLEKKESSISTWLIFLVFLFKIGFLSIFFKKKVVHAEDDKSKST